MHVLVVVSDRVLGRTWADHIGRSGAEVRVAVGEREARSQLDAHEVDLVVLDLTLADGGALAVADEAWMRRPNATILYSVPDEDLVDPTLLALSPNASAFVRSDVPPAAFAAEVGRYAAAL